jgi:hypothetical protein
MLSLMTWQLCAITVMLGLSDGRGLIKPFG